MSKKAILFCAVVCSVALFACGGHEEKKQNDGVVPDTAHGVSANVTDTTHGETAYICPCGGCPEVKEAAPGKCPKCQMDLVADKK